MTTTAFHPNVLLTPESAKLFLNGEQAKAEVMRYTPSVSTSHGRTWDGSWIDLDELYYLFSGFVLTLSSYMLHPIGFSDLSKRAWVMSRHAIANATAINTQKVFEANLLARSINAHRLDTDDYYLQPRLQTPLHATSTSMDLNFFLENGICRGMCYWFVFLYFKTQSHFANPDQHIRALGQQFVKGASRESAFLHALPELRSVYDLLGLNAHHDNSRISAARKTIDQIIREFQCRVPGVYGIYTSTHQVIYINIDDNHQYLFDPNQGCVNIASTQLFKKAMERYLESHDNTKDILIDRYSPR